MYWVTGGGSCVSEETIDEIGAGELVSLRRRRPPDFPDADPSRSLVEDCVRSRRGILIDGVP